VNEDHTWKMQLILRPTVIGGERLKEEDYCVHFEEHVIGRIKFASEAIWSQSRMGLVHQSAAAHPPPGEAGARMIWKT
jgi:hypothetical protein